MTEQVAEAAAVDSAAPVETSEVLSKAETEFFKSGGEKTEGLAEAKTPEAKAGDTTEDKDDKKGTERDPETGKFVPKGFVPHGAFHAEREGKKAAQQELTELREKFARTDERVRLLNEALAPKKEEEVIPDPETDIFGFVRHQAKLIEELKGTVTKTSESTEAIKTETQLKNAYISDAQNFATKNPEFGAAYQHVLASRDKQLQRIGITDATQRAQMIVDEERGLVERALRSKQSPAEMIFGLAQDLGFTPKQAAKVAEEAATNGASEDKTPPVKSPAEEQVERIQKGQNASKSLSNVGGSASEALTPEALANMPQDEFEALLSKLPKSKQRALLGG